jgi:hypothetical protein
MASREGTAPSATLQVTETSANTWSAHNLWAQFATPSYRNAVANPRCTQPFNSTPNVIFVAEFARMNSSSEPRCSGHAKAALKPLYCGKLYLIARQIYSCSIADTESGG